MDSNRDVDDEEKEKNLSEDELIEKHIKELDEEMNGELSEDDKENIRNILKYVGQLENKSNAQIFFSHVRDVIIKILIYFLVYLAMYGIFNGIISLEKPYYIIIFNAILALYQGVFKKLLDLTFKIPKHKMLGAFLFNLISLVILYLINGMIPGIRFESVIYLGFYYIIGEVIILLGKYYLSRHLLSKVLK